MKHERFTELVKKRFDHCWKLLIPKGEEYSRKGDRLHNFKAAGEVDGTIPERALWGMYKKHLVCIMDMISDIEAGKPLPSQETIAEKFGDAINYHLLLEALIEDRREKTFTAADVLGTVGTCFSEGEGFVCQYPFGPGQVLKVKRGDLFPPGSSLMFGGSSSFPVPPPKGSFFSKRKEEKVKKVTVEITSNGFVKIKEEWAKP